MSGMTAQLDKNSARCERLPRMRCGHGIPSQLKSLL